jgi:hypothetical protein
MNPTKASKKILRHVLAALPDNPFVKKRRARRRKTLAYGAIGVVVLGGIAAILMLTPRTRREILGIAKDKTRAVGEKIRPHAQPNGVSASGPVAMNVE